MNNWLTIRNIILGIGSVSLSFAFFNFLILTRLTSFRVDYALTLVTPLLIYASIAYVVGFLDYYTGKKPQYRNKTQKPMKHQFSKYANPFWGLHIGAFVTPVLLALHLVNVSYSGFGGSNLTFILGIPSPMFYSVIGGATVGIVVLLINYTLSTR